MFAFCFEVEQSFSLRPFSCIHKHFRKNIVLLLYYQDLSYVYCAQYTYEYILIYKNDTMLAEG